MESDSSGRGAGVYGIEHNPGYDFLRLVNWLSETDVKNPNLPFAAYMVPVVSLISACCAIEAYINMIGQHIDPDWAQFEKGPITIKERISRIYERLGKTPEFGQGVFHNTIALFKMRIDLVHPRYKKAEEKRKEHIPNLFEVLNAKFSPSKSKEIADNTIDLLLKDARLTDLKNNWILRSYAGSG
jgi:hypothetical protein